MSFVASITNCDEDFLDGKFEFDVEGEERRGHLTFLAKGSCEYLDKQDPSYLHPYSYLSCSITRSTQWFKLRPSVCLDTPTTGFPFQSCLQKVFCIPSVLFFQSLRVFFQLNGLQSRIRMCCRSHILENSVSI